MDTDTPDAPMAHGAKAPRRVWRLIELASVWATIAVIGAVALMAVMNHPHRAVLILVAGLFGLALMRAVWLPGYRLWFASRHRWFDVTFFSGLGALIWLLSPFTATMGQV